MDSLWIREFVFLYFQFFYILMIHTAEMVTTIRYPEENAVNISCWQTSIIQIQNISVQDEATSCGPNQCVLNSNDTHTIEDNCNGVNSCMVDYNFTSACLRGFRYINMSYTCTHEIRTILNTFEENYGDWVNVFSNKFNWTRTANEIDHTGVSRGYSISTTSTFSPIGSASIETIKEFGEPICLSLWYQRYSYAHDCALSIYKTYDGNQTLIFTTSGKSTSLNTWNKISVDVYDKVPFKLTLVATFYHNRYLYTARRILVDDTSIAYRPCQGQKIDTTCQDVETLDTTCQDVETLIQLECETQFLAGDITFTFQQENHTIQQTDCQVKSIENELNTFCRNFNKSDKCKFRVLDFMTKYKNCIVFNKNISVTYECINNSQTIINMEIQTDSRIHSEAGITVIVVSTLVFIIVAASVSIVIVCNTKNRAQNLKLCQAPQNTTASKMIDSSDYNVINYEEMTDISNRKMNKTKNKTHTTQHQQQNIKNSIEQDENRYESLLTSRNSAEHVYESDSKPICHYESLKNQQQFEEHTYKSTEDALPVSTKQELSQYESLTSPRESDKHTYESTEHALPESMKQELSQYESLTSPPESDKHTYESTEDALPVATKQELSQYESLTSPRESDKHTYESTEHASSESMKQELSQYESLTSPLESDKHTYASTEDALPVSTKQELSQYESLTSPPESDKHTYESIL